MVARRLFTLLAALPVVGAACGSSSSDPGIADDVYDPDGGGSLGRCPSLDGRTFESVELQPDCGLGPDGPVPCKWGVVFDQTMTVYTNWTYHHSDVGESGDIRCSGATIVSVSGGHSATYDADIERLVWDGILYQPVVP